MMLLCICWLLFLFHCIPLSTSQQITGGFYHTCALDAVYGSVYCWGSNGVGQIGDGNTATTNRLTPTLVSGMSSGVSQIALGYSHSCALISSSGSMYCWGWNTNGQLGDGTNVNRFAPVMVSGMSSSVTAITAGYVHTCAIKSGGVLFCWGGNANYQVGEGTSSTTDRRTPYMTISSDMITVTAGYYHTCAILSNNVVKCWGHNAYAQLGTGAANV